MTVAEEIKSIAETLSDDATWEDAMYEIYVRQKLAKAEKDIEEGRTRPQSEVIKMFSNISIPPRINYI